MLVKCKERRYISNASMLFETCELMMRVVPESLSVVLTWNMWGGNLATSISLELGVREKPDPEKGTTLPCPSIGQSPQVRVTMASWSWVLSESVMLSNEPKTGTGSPFST